MPALNIQAQDVRTSGANRSCDFRRHSVRWLTVPDLVDRIEELSMRLRPSAFGYSPSQRFQALPEGFKLRIIGERDQEPAIREVEHPQTRSAKLVLIYGSSQFEDKHQTRVDPEHRGPLTMAHPDLVDRSPEAAAVAREVTVTAFTRKPRPRPSIARLEGALEPEQREASGGPRA